MGAKIEFYFLSEANTSDILEYATRTLLEKGWSYNVVIKGQYTYWLDGPIYEFGDSKTVIEQSSLGDSSALSDVVFEVSKHYSPSIYFGIQWFSRSISAALSVIEAADNWKWLLFTFDRFESLDALPVALKEDAKEQIFNLFTELAQSIKPFYGIGGTELYVPANRPEELSLQQTIGGDFYYISELAKEKLSVGSHVCNYLVINNPDNSMICSKAEELLELV